MKKKVMPVFLSVILVIALMATPIFAKDNQSEGQPFQEIWETITELQEWVGKFIENDPVFMASPVGNILSTDIDKWNTAYVWGDHSTAGYLTSVPSQYMEEGEGVSLLNNDAGYLTSVPSQYMEEGEGVSLLNNDAGYLTSVPSQYMEEGEGVSLLNNDAGYITQSDIPKLQVWQSREWDTVYNEDKDGFVVVSANAANDGEIFILIGYWVPGKTPPPTHGHPLPPPPPPILMPIVSASSHNGDTAALTFPIPKNLDWGVRASSSTSILAYRIYWIPFGN
jgi:hypothetical protein